MSFASDVRRFTLKTEQALDKTTRAITFALFRSVIQDTPVDTGRLKGNWQVSTGAPITGTVTTTDRTGSVTIASMSTAIGGWGDITFMTNNLPYAEPIEYGHSHTKAPEGMVRKNMARIQHIVAAEARKNRV